MAWHFLGPWPYLLGGWLNRLGRLQGITEELIQGQFLPAQLRCPPGYVVVPGAVLFAMWEARDSCFEHLLLSLGFGVAGRCAKTARVQGRRGC